MTYVIIGGIVIAAFLFGCAIGALKCLIEIIDEPEDSDE